MITEDQAEKARKLIAILRDPKSWPKGFSWDYSKYWQDGCGCAMPLAVMAGLVEDDEVEHMTRALGMPVTTATGIFECAGFVLKKEQQAVSADDVAGMIEEWLQTAEQPRAGAA